MGDQAEPKKRINVEIPWSLYRKVQALDKSITEAVTDGLKAQVGDANGGAH